MVGLGRYTGALILLLLAIHCKAKPLQSEENTSKDEVNTTPCPEELAQKLETLKENEENEQNTVPLDNIIPKTELPNHNEDVTTLCPDELEKRKSEEGVSDENKSDNLEGNIENSTAKQSNPNSDLENIADDLVTSAQEETTICPEELKKKTENAKNEVPSLQETFSGISPTFLNKLNSKDSDDISANTPKIEENISYDTPKQQSEDRFDNEIGTSQWDKIQQSGTEKSTICPEELLKEQEQVNLDVQPSAINALATELLPPKEKENRFKNPPETDKKQALVENDDVSSTVCPDDINNKQEENSNEVSASALLNVQKNSALFQLVKDKLKSSAAAKDDERHTIRTKRQTASYSPYYSNQPTYNAQGISLTSNDVSGQNNQNQNSNKGLESTGIASPQYSQQSNYNLKTSNPQRAPVSNNNVRTYQQIQRQYQNFYPKSYHNYVKPVKGSYQNTPYARYPSNGNFNNYYKKGPVNRRQSQANTRQRNTTVRPTRVPIPIKKKFRPSPVFA